MRAPFPYALTIGTDISHARRILDWSNPTRFEHNSYGLSLLKRVFHQNDFIQLQRRYPWWQRPRGLPEANVRSLSLFLAGRWAAKEAAKKAWRADLLGWRDLWVETAAGSGSVAPEIVCRVNRNGWNFDEDELLKLAGEDVAADNVRGGQEGETAVVDEQVARLSISHDGEYAIAAVLATPLHASILTDLKQRQAEVDLRMRMIMESSGQPS
ncbi:hypothetical protein DV737_g3079, partial [Chaetothyriales sp. CBS 132003]